MFSASVSPESGIDRRLPSVASAQQATQTITRIYPVARHGPLPMDTAGVDEGNNDEK
jgi:hypothetical protein